MRLVIHAWRDLANPNAGGSERHIDQLAVSMFDCGHDVVLVAGGPVGPRPYRVVCSGGTYTQYLRVPAVDRHLEDPDLVIDLANGMTYCSPLWRRGPVALMCHHVHVDQWGTHFPAPIAAAGRAFETRVMPRVYRDRFVIACSPSTKESLVELGYDPDLVRVVVPGVAAPGPGEVTSESTVPEFVTIGRLMPYKRVDLLLEAWKVVRRTTGGTLHVVGDGPQRSALESMAVEGVVFHGHVAEAEKRAILGRSWLLVHGAMHEGWGIVITEAGVMGTPTLAFDVDGVRDAAQGGGVLVDDIDEMITAWIQLASEPARRAELGEAARRAAAAYTEGASGDAFENVCLDAVARHRSRHR